MKTLLRLLAAALTLLVVGVSSDRAATCTDTAARNLLASAMFEETTSPPGGEDQDFIERSAGVPNIFVLLDNSGSMRRLPPNGPAYYPGTLPPLKDYGCTGTGDAVDPLCANAALAAHTADCALMGTCPVIGCGLDPESAKYAGDGTLIQWLTRRSYSSPCGDSVSDRLGIGTVGVTFDGAKDYAREASVCRYWKNPDPVTGADGFDPEHYCGSVGDVTTCTSGKPNFFDKDMVFHDVIVDAPPVGPNDTSGKPLWTAPADGWTDLAVNPYQVANKPATIDDMCQDVYGNSAKQGAQLKREICSTCLKTRGFLLDGRLFRKNQEGRTESPEQPYPSIWYSGNWLNFYPPKFAIARKVMKDIIMDRADIRLGFAHYGAPGADATNGEWQPLQPTCGMSETSNFSSMRGTYINQINTVKFDGGTPLARALLDVGQYYHSPGLPWWNHSNTWNSPSNANQLSICYACQISSIIAITDGLPKSTDGNDLPVGTVTAAQVDSLYAGDAKTGIKPDASGVGGIPTSLCKSCNDFPATEDWKNNPARVAWYLHNMDLRKTDESTEDCMGQGGKQTLNVYTVGFATQSLGDANRLLANTAKMGGGSFESADDPSALKDAVVRIFNRIVERSTSFSVATVSTLQTTSGHSVIVPRFDPDNDSNLWKGHLSRYELYSEFLNPCVESTTGTGDGDLDCDGKCASVFLTDKDGKFISEDADGVFRRNDPNAPYCIQAPLCASRGKPCGMPGTSLAVPWWDAADVLAKRAWKDRLVYTVVDGDASGNTDGRIDSSDVVFRLEPTDAVSAKIKPYLGDLEICDRVGAAISAAGDSATGMEVMKKGDFCVKQIIRFVLGADLFNKIETTGETWPLAATDDGQNQLADRDFKLGDIFHSSPVVVDPPLPADGILCPNGLHNQCLLSLWSTPTPFEDKAVNPYQQYAKSTEYADRRKIILVGANDGLLHAFDGGVWHPNTDDPVTDGIDESIAPFNGYYDRGTGEELWGFLSPDMIGKVRSYLLQTQHTLFVDGSPMVRDVWVDGTSNAIGSGSKDGKKGPAEFHTVAVMGERRGGTHYFALDISDASYLPSEKGGSPPAPKFLWLYPQPDDRESVTFGQTYTDFLPVGPPIGPVRIEADAVSGAAVADVTPKMAVEGVGEVPYHERWVAFLSGGFDPHYLRGRGVHMVDVWTGQEIFDFSYPDDGASSTAEDKDLRLQLKYPVASTVAMVMWGQNELRQASFENEGFFDTATFGDTGGQLWVLRFSQPAKLDATTKRAKNWYGARMFSMSGCANQPFFYITANVAVRQGYYRVLVGTGDRLNLLDKNGGDCDADNPRACWQRGCTVTLDSTNRFQQDGAGGVTRQFGLSGASCSTVTAASAVVSPAACEAGGAVKMAINCGGATATTKLGAVNCTLGADGYQCNSAIVPGVKLAPGTAITDGNWYFSLRVFDATGNRAIFGDATTAKNYDAARLTLSSKTSASAGIVILNGGDGVVPTTLSTFDGPGWAMYYNHDAAVSIDDHKYTVAAVDERTSSTSAVYAGVYWNTTQPTIGSADRLNQSGKCSKSAKCVAEGRRATYHYGADVTSGAFVLRDSLGNLVRSTKNITLVPAMGDQATVFVNQKGQIQVGLTAVNPERGATNVFGGESKDPTTDYGLVEVSRPVHACRHAVDQAAADQACQ